MRSSSSTWASRSPRRSSRSSCKFRDRPSAVAPERATPPHKEFTMIRPMIWRALALAVFAAGAPPAHAAEVYQVSTISSLLAGGYDGDTTVGHLLRHGGFRIGNLQRGGRRDDGARWPRL